MTDHTPHTSEIERPPRNRRLEALEEELAHVRSDLEKANTRLQKSHLEQQLVRQEADSAYESVKKQNEELKEQVSRFRTFVPQSLSAVLDRRGFDVAKGISLEQTYSVFSTDIRSFTTFSETITCRECFWFLNSFFTVMEPVIRQHGGFVYQYVGDSIMALFPLLEDKFADNAVEAAVHVQAETMPAYNAGRRRAGYEPIRIGIGLNTGSVATGVAGTRERMDVCAIGSTVNLAARCEGMTKESDADVILTEYTKTLLANDDAYGLESLGKAEIRGMEQRVELFKVGAASVPD